MNSQQLTRNGPGIKQWRLIIRNLSFETTEEHIREWAGTFGTIREIVLPKCKDKRFPNSSAGFCFVQFSSRKNAVKAKECLNFTELNGRKVAIDWTLDKDNYITQIHEEKKSKLIVKTEPKEESKSADEEKGVNNDEGKEKEQHNDYEENETSQSTGRGKIDKSVVKKEHQKKRVPTSEDVAVAEGRVVFIGNIPFSVDDVTLKTMAAEFGEVRLGILCRNKDTGDSTGKAFVHFREKESADNFLDQLTTENGVLMEGRKIFGYRAVQRKDAQAFNTADKKPIKDKRNLYLMRMSLVRPGTAQTNEMSEEDAKLRQRLMEMAKDKLSNLVMFVSPLRLIIHNVPFSLTDAQLKSICLESVGGCPPSSISECRIMRQRTGEDAKGRAQLGKSKGFAFVAFTAHTLALKCLKNLNNNPATFTNQRRPIVEFSIENLNALRTKERRYQNTAKSNENMEQKKDNLENAEALEKTKRELMAGGKKWLPKKFGAKIRHKDRSRRPPSDALRGDRQVQSVTKKLKQRGRRVTPLAILPKGEGSHHPYNE